MQSTNGGSVEPNITIWAQHDAPHSHWRLLGGPAPGAVTCYCSDMRTTAMYVPFLTEIGMVQIFGHLSHAGSQRRRFMLSHCQIYCEVPRCNLTKLPRSGCKVQSLTSG